MKQILPILSSLKLRLAYFAQRAAGFFSRLRPTSPMGSVAPVVLKGVLLLVALLVLVPAAQPFAEMEVRGDVTAAAPAATTTVPASAIPTMTPASLQTAAATPAPTPTPYVPTPSPGISLTPHTEPVTATVTIAPTATAAAAKPSAKPPAKPSKPTLLLRVYKGSQTTVAIRLQDGKETAERVMICSTGRTSNLTPEGTFKIYAKYSYRQLQGAMGQYCSRFNGGILFHSVPIDNAAKKMSVGKSRMKISNYEKLGSMDSDGCVRLLARDALWIYNNCPNGTRVEVVSGSSPYGTGSKPALKSGPPYRSEDGQYGWDPTDPDPGNPYRKPQPTASPTAAPTQQPPVTPTATEAPLPSPTASEPATQAPGLAPPRGIIPASPAAVFGLFGNILWPGCV